jgi:hypothetical protein
MDESDYFAKEVEKKSRADAQVAKKVGADVLTEINGDVKETDLLEDMERDVKKAVKSLK